MFTITIEFVYFAASTVAVIAMAPQIKQLIVTKRSDEFNLGSWSVWGFSQFIALMYGISLGALPYIIVNTIWLVYYATMVGFILHYRRRQPSSPLAQYNYLQPEFESEY